MKRFGLTLVMLWGLVQAQVGGRNSWDFLNLSPAARTAALGGVNITSFDDDVTFAYNNPALANDSMHHHASFSIVNYLSDITYGYFGYGRSFADIGDFHAGIQYVGYGKMIEADEYGTQLGEFSAGDIAFVVGGARQVDNFRAGVNLKLMNSSVRGYQSDWALAFDMGGLYVSDNERTVAGMAFKNMGFNLSNRNLPEGVTAALPFTMQIGISHRLEHMPMRFSVTVNNLENPNLIYTDPNAEPQFDLSGEPIVEKKPVVDNIFRHFVFGTEFLLSKSFNLRAGYNHLRRQELRNTNRAGLSGFSFGVGLKVSRFRLDYGLAVFHAIGSTHQFTVATDLGSWKKK